MSALKIPDPKVETGDDFARAKLYWYADLNEWTKEDKIRTCYLVTCYFCTLADNLQKLSANTLNLKSFGGAGVRDWV